MTTDPKSDKLYILPWPCLQSNSYPPSPKPSISNPKLSTQQKTFAQAVNNICNILVCQLPKPTVKGDLFSIEIPDDEYEAGLADCKFNLHGRIILPKGSRPVNVEELRRKLATGWKSLGRWGITSFGKGYFELSFSSIEDLRRVRSVGSWNLQPGILKFFTWTQDFNSRIQNQTSVQVWMRIYGLSQEYWRKNILFAIAGSVGTPICTDSITCKPLMERSFGHFARVLVDLDIFEQLRYGVMVERKGYAFHVDFEYENLPDFCSFCKNIGHYVDNCRKRNMVIKVNDADKQPLTKVNVLQDKPYAQKAQNTIYVEKLRTPEVIMAEPQPKSDTPVRSIEDVELEAETNAELKARQEEKYDDGNNERTYDAGSGEVHSTDGSEFIDATQKQDDNSDEEATINNTTPEVVLKDVALIKETWANDAEQQHNDHEESPCSKD